MRDIAVLKPSRDSDADTLYTDELVDLKLVINKLGTSSATYSANGYTEAPSHAMEYVALQTSNYDLNKMVYLGDRGLDAVPEIVTYCGSYYLVFREAAR
jgi:hypothetical protein